MDMATVWNIFGKPYTVALAVAAGIVIGLRRPDLAAVISPLGNIYMSFLSMCALPIIVLSVMSCIGEAIRSGVPRDRLLRTVVVFVLGGLMASCIGMALILFLGGDMTGDIRIVLGRTFMNTEHVEVTKAMTMWDLLSSLVPENVFSALSGGRFLACIFFSMLLGAALGCIKSDIARSIIEGLGTFCAAFYQIMRWGLKFLAIGLFCMVAGQFATMRLEILPALGRLIALFFIGCLLLCTLYALALRRATGQTIFQVINHMGQSAGVAFVAASSALAMPLAFEGLEKGLGQKPAVIRFTLPLGVAINRQAYAMLFSMLAVFVLRLQDVSASPGTLAVIAFCTVLAGMPASGSPAMIAPMVAYVLAPVGLPVSLGVGVLIVVSPMIDSVASMTNLCASCSAAAIVNSLESRSTELTPFTAGETAALGTATKC
jgi:proton glutamate symport protein